MKSQPTEPLDEELLPPPRPQRIDESVVSVATYCTRCRAYGSTHPAAFNTRRLPRCGCGGIMVEVAPGAEQFTHFPQTKPDHCDKEPSPPPLDPTGEFETYCEPCTCRRKMTGTSLNCRRPARCNCGQILQVRR